jgi:membrane AbrB-like protein
VLGAPLPWLLGALFVATAGAVAGLPVFVPAGLRNMLLAVLGVVVGSGYSPERLGGAVAWLPTLAGVALYVAVAGGLGFLLLRRFGLDTPTAFFGAMPGGISEMVFLSGAFDGDMRAVALIHAIRILVTVTLIAAWAAIAGPTVASPEALSGIDISMRDTVYFIVAAAMGAAAGRILRLPAGFLLGPMLASALAQFIGIVDSRPPAEIAALAQIGIGAAIGSRFGGVRLHEMLRAGVAGGAVTALLASCALITVLTLTQISNIGGGALLLAFAPAGIAEMTAISATLELEPSFVAVHHLWRVLLIVSITPLLYRTIKWRHAPEKKMTSRHGG